MEVKLEIFTLEELYEQKRTHSGDNPCICMYHNILTSKTTIETMPNLLDAGKAAINLFQVDLDRTRNYLMTLFTKKRLRPRCPLLKS